MSFWDMVNPVKALNPFDSSKNPFSQDNPARKVIGGGMPWDDRPGANNDYYGGQPDRPAYIPGWNQSRDSAVVYNDNLKMPGTDQFSQEAMRSGPSNWANLAMGQQAYEQTGARDSAARQAAAQTAGATSQLAMRGGVTSGARERIAKSGMNNALDMNQGIARQGMQNRLQIGVNDEQNRIQQLGMMPGIEQGKNQMAMQARQFDIGNLTDETAKQNVFNSNVYNQQMKAWGAGKTADAQANAGK